MFDNSYMSGYMYDLGYRNMSEATIVGASKGLCGKAIALFGTLDQQRKWLPLLAFGHTTGAFALTEANAGSDIRNISATALLHPGKTHYILNGTKKFITNGPTADVFVIFVKTDIDEYSAFLVERGIGLTSGKDIEKMGLHGSPTSELQLNQCYVAAENILGKKGDGLKIAMEVLSYGRFNLAASCMGSTLRIIHDIEEYAEKRVQFGKPIIEYKPIKRYIEDSRKRLMRLGKFFDHVASYKGRAFGTASAIVKIVASELLWETADRAVQIAGGNGYVCGYPFEMFLRDARITRIFEGSNEVLHLLIKHNLLKLFKKNLFSKDFWKLFSYYILKM